MLFWLSQKKKKKSLSHDPTSEVVPPHLSELVATACSEETRARNPSRGPACSSAWPPCGVHFIAVATAGPRRQAGKIQNTDVSMGLQGQLGSCCFGKRYSSYGWAHLSHQPPQSHWASKCWSPCRSCWCCPIIRQGQHSPAAPATPPLASPSQITPSTLTWSPACIWPTWTQWWLQGVGGAPKPNFFHVSASS